MATSLEIPKPSNFTLYARTFPEDITVANIVECPALPEHERAINHSLMVLRETMRQRVRMKIGTEVLVKWRGNSNYKRLRGARVVVSAPNAEQAELFIQALTDFAASLDGKWLAPPPQGDPTPADPTPGTK